MDTWVPSHPMKVRGDRRETFVKMSHIVYRSGLPAIGVGNPLAVYTTTGARKTTREEDRIYAIQQIFEARVGTSAPDYKPGLALTLTELEIQLGEKLLQDHPVLSQMHVFTEPVPAGKRWLVKPSSVVLEDVAGWDQATAYPRDTHQSYYRPWCKLSVRRIGAQAWGHFEGRMCWFTQLQKVCKSWSSELRRESASWESEPIKMMELEHRHMSQVYRCLKIAVDDAVDVSPRPVYRQDGMRAEDFPPSPDQNIYWEALESFPIDELRVLLLGTCFTLHRIVLGILLLPCGGSEFKYYRRIGICWWDLSWANIRAKPLPQYGFLSGEHESWEPQKGLFG